MKIKQQSVLKTNSRSEMLKMIRNGITGQGIFRVLKRNAIFTSVNIIGLVVGISAFILISFTVYNSVTYEDFNRHADETCRILTEPEGEQATILSICKLSELLSSYPQVTRVCRITPYFVNLSLKFNNSTIRESRIIAADTNFFRFFSYELMAGDYEAALKGPDKIVLSEDMSKKYFGTDNPLGKNITVLFGNTTREMLITGIFKDLPAKTNLDFDFVISNINGNGKFRNDDPWYNWELLSWITYIQLAPEVRAETFESLISDQLIKRDPSSKYHLRLQKLKRVHLYSGSITNADMLTRPGNIRHTRIMIVTGIIILFTACLNFIILTYADSMSRTKEIVIRKIFGSSISALIRRFFLEMSTYVLIALCISLILIPLFINILGKTTGQDFQIAGFDLRLVISLLLALSVINILTGSYPAFYLYKTKSLSFLPGSPAPGRKGQSMLKVLLTIQIMVSLVLIFCTIVLSRQTSLIRNFNLGFDTENVVYIPCDDIPYDYRTGITVVKDALKKIPSVENVSCGSELPLAINYYMDEADWDGKEQENRTRFHYLKTEHDFLKTLNIKLIAGRDFSDEIISDDSCYLVNEAAARVLDSESILGRNFTYIFRETDRITGKIIGITDDFHFNTLYNKTEPLVIGIQVGKPHYIFVRLRPGAGTVALSEIRQALKDIYPGISPETEFLSQAFHQQYIQEIQTSKVFSIFCIIAMLITMFGLFGQSAFTLEKRKLELSIRKVNGATLVEIMTLLSREYLAVITVAFVIAVPVGYLAMTRWLQYFAYKTRIDAVIIIATALAGTLMISIAMTWQLYLQGTKSVMETIRVE